jgi:hypothetical protein
MPSQVVSLERGVSAYDVWSVILGDEGKKPRLRPAKTFFRNLHVGDISLLTEAFKCWRDFDEYLVIKGEHRETGEKKFYGVKCSKRGNDVYGERTRKRLGFLKGAENLVFFKKEDFDCKKIVKTRLLWMTFSFDSKLCSLKDSWVEGEHYWNLMITNLRNKYGRIQVIKFPQASPWKQGEAYGYLHYHAVLLFQDHEFSVFPWMNGEGKLEYRIHERDELRAQAKWHSFIDIKAISSMEGIHNYAVKHHENAGWGDSEEAVLNNAMCWLFKKKSYTISGDFRPVYSEFIRSMHNSKAFQMTLDGEKLPVWVWSFVGIVSLVELCRLEGISWSSPWFVSLSDSQVGELVGGVG